MYNYLGQRLLYMIGIMVIMSVLVFGAVHSLPGSAAVVMLGQYATPEAIAAIEERLGLDQPLYIQYLRWTSDFIRGNFGDSLSMSRPVAAVFWPAFGKSAILAMSAFIVVAIAGIVSGVIAAVWHKTYVDRAVSLISYLGISLPEFFWGIILLIVFSSWLGWFPMYGYAPLNTGLWNFASHLILPILTLTLTLIAHVSRQTRSSMLEVLTRPYIKAARAKGLSETTIITRHALRNALLPTITVLAQDFGWLIGGIVAVETVFGFPGIGRLLVFGIERHDLPLIQPIILALAICYCLSNLIADLLYALVNPQIRFGNGAR